MFYCNPCADECGWPKTFAVSYGTCEICGKAGACNDCPTSHLPRVTAGDVERVTGKEAK